MLHQISHLGVIFLLFTVGLHINLKNIVQLDVLGVGIPHLMVSTAIFTPICLFFGLNTEAALFIGITLGFSSTVLTAKMLESRNELGSFYGRIAIGILILQDLVAIGLIAYAGGGIPSVWAIGLLGLPLLRPVFTWLLKVVGKDELVMLMALSLAMGGDLLFSSLNLSGELGALVIGMLFANDERGEQLEKKIWSIKEAFLVGFFLEIGLGGLPSSDTYNFILLLLLLLPVKALLFYGLFMYFKLRSWTGFLATSTLTAYSEFTLIAGTVAVSANIIPAEYIVILGLLTAISYMVNTLIVVNESRIWSVLEPYLDRFERDVKHPDHQPIALGAAEYLVIGLGVTGAATYDLIKRSEGKVVGFDIDPDVVIRHIEKGKRALYADVQDSDLWEELDMSKVQSIMITMSTNIDLKKQIVSLIKEKNGFKGPIHVLTANERESETIRRMGASPVSIPSIQVGEKIAEAGMSRVQEEVGG